jgi:hypothetical protein
MGSTTHKHFLKLVHHPLFFRNFRVNNLFAIITITADLQGHRDHQRFLHTSIFVNKSVDMNSLSDLIFLIICSQFIERTEMDGGSQQIEVGRLKDNPR